MSATGSVVIHGHFYQPPREDPWFGLVPTQPSAAPFHDWNQRVERECYGPVTGARVLDDQGRVRRMVNTLAHVSFDFGPTLLRWLEREAALTYGAVVEADRVSRVRTGGHGNAMAMPYHHAILPLSTRRDKRTEVRWGVADFRRRFGREPLGMWLPETAVDDETLDVLAAEGLAFTVLAPRQVREAPEGGLPGLYRTQQGREIAVFVYDGPLSHGVAFGEMLRDAERWARRMARAVAGHDPARLVCIATDGESYGHHHTFGEMALARALDDLARTPGVRVESFEAFLARNPPTRTVELVEPSSWSCAHGVDRWRRECGCKLDPSVPSRQDWRASLRAAVEWLVSELDALYQTGAGRLADDPWALRDAFGQVLDESWEARTAFVVESGLEAEAAGRLVGLLEMSRQGLASLTSCGWFFDDLARIETVQVLRHAARAVELAGESGPALESGFLKLLAAARSNDPLEGDGARIYRRRAAHDVPAAVRAAAGFVWARELSGEGPPWMGDFSCRCRDGRVQVADRALGREWTLEVGVRPGPEPAVDVSDPATGRTWRLQSHDLPEAARRKAADGARRRFAQAWLGDGERDDPGGAAPELPPGWVRGLVRAVEDLAAGTGRERDVGVRDLTVLLDGLPGATPAPVQAAVWRMSTAGDRDLVRALAPLAHRLGFAEPWPPPDPGLGDAASGDAALETP